MASLANPSLLASFSVPSSSTTSTTSSKRKSLQPRASSSSSSAIHISPIASSSTHPHRNPELVLSAPSGGGVWIYDLSTQQALTSYTVSPGTTLAGGPVSWSVPRGVSERAKGEGVVGPEGSKEKWVRRTGVPVEVESGKGSVWVWDGEDVFEKTEVQTTHPVSTLYHIPQSNSILATSPTSPALTILTPSLKPISLPLPSHSIPSSSKSSLQTELVSIHLIPLPTAKSSTTVPGATICILTYSSGVISTFVLSPVDAMEEEWTIGSERKVDALSGKLGEGERVVEGVVDEVGGGISLITSTGRVYPKVVLMTSSPSTGLVISRTTSESSPKPYTFHATSTLNPSLPTTSIQTHPSSLLLSSLPATPTTPCTLILHHPLYPSVLATLSLPRTLSRVLTPQKLGNELVGLVGITKSQAEEKEGHDGKEKGVVMIVEVGVGSRGVGIAQLMGSGAGTRKWLKVEGEDDVVGEGVGKEGFSEKEQTFLESFESTLAGSKAGDEATLTKLWNDFEAGINSSNSSAIKPDTTRQLASRLIKSIFSATLGPAPPPTESTIPSTTNNTAESLLTTVEASLKHGLKSAYPKEVVQGLLEKGWVGDGMWSEGGGVLVGLARAGDWETIDIALRTFASVPSATLVLLLNLVLRASAPLDPDAMDTSTPTTTTSSIPSLQTFIHTYIRVPVSLPLHRVALFKGLRNVEDVVRVLEVLEGRLEESEAVRLGLEEVEKVLVEETSEEKLIVQHITLLLDSHLDALLSYSPAQDLLARFQDWVQPAQRAQVELSLAKGVIDAFMRANKVDCKTAGKKGGKGKQAAGGKAQVGVSLLGKREFDGLYSLEEVVL